MSHNIDLDKFMKGKGYTKTDKQVSSFGDIDKVNEDYDVWLKVDVTKRYLGVKVDHGWKWFHLGKLYSVRTRTTRKMYKKAKVTSSGNSSSNYFDDTPEEILGGAREYLGA